MTRTAIPANSAATYAWPRQRLANSTFAIVASGAVLTAFTSLVAIKEGGDDAYIVYRYVMRWLDGRGLTYNDGEFVEGFTSLTWPILIGTASWLTGLEVAVAALLLNYSILIGTAALMAWTLRAAGAVSTGLAIAVVMYSTSYAYFQVVFLGLEHGLFALLLTFFYALMFSALRSGGTSRRATLFVALGAAGALLFATRPEALVVLPATLLVVPLINPTVRRRDIGLAAACYGMAVLAILLWRRAYYDEWLPNSVIAKSLSLNDPHLRSVIERRFVDGATYLADAYMAHPVLAVIVITAALLALTRGLRARTVLLFIPIVWGHIVLVQNGGDWMPFHRLVTMYTPVYLLAGWAVAADLYVRHGRPVTVLATAGALALHVWASVRTYTTDEYTAIQVAKGPVVTFTPDVAVNGFSHTYVSVARALKEVWVNGDILASESIGLVGYVAPRIYIHDPFGLTDRTLSHDATAGQDVFGRKNWKYSMSLKPSVVLLHSWQQQRRWSTFDIGYPDQFDRYCVRSPIDEGDDFALYVVIRKERPQYARAIERIGGRYLQTGAAGDQYCPSAAERHAPNSRASRAGKL